MTVYHLLVYFSLLVFVAAVIARMVWIARMPVHLRWELYPVPHEKGRAKYGGSAAEEVDWWTKPRKVDRLGELSVMIPEILFLRGVWEHNRPLWLGSFTLHFGLYLLIGELGMFVLAGIISAAGAVGFLYNLILSLTTVLAWSGCIIGILGAVMMLIKRLSDPRLKAYTNASHLFNLILLGAIYVTGLIWVASDAGYSAKIAGFFEALISVGVMPSLPGIGIWHIGVVLFFFIYFPFTHMTHAFVKYFTYHDIRWEDEPNLPGGKLQSKIEKLMNQPVTWAAPHVNADGRKTWVEIATETGEVKKEKSE